MNERVRARAPVKGLPRSEPWRPPDYEPEDAYAVQALMHGRASEAQQLRAVEFIVQRVCATYDLSYRPASDRDSAFAEGKRFVGLQMVKLANLDIARLRGRAAEQGDRPKEQPR